MTQEITLVPFRDGLAKLLKCKSGYHAALNPDSPTYDPLLPRTVPIGSAPNSPRAFLEHELREYIQKLVTRARSSSERDSTSKAARNLVAARKSRRSALQGE